MNRLASAFTSMVAAAALTAIPGAICAQTAASPAIAPPILPLVVNYSYWPTQFVQFIGPELPYSMIELDVDPGNGKHPLLYATLTDRATGKRVHYTDDDGLIASAAAVGEEVHKTALAFDAADTDNPGSISTLRFSMPDGKPLEWRFVLGSDISEQGSGLNPFPDAKIPIFAYREQGGLAGEGTALQVGDTVSTASVWTEYSHPPYFIPYRGAETEGAHVLIFIPGEEKWTIVSSPVALTVGATWELDGDKGNHRSIRIDKVDGPQLTVTSTDRFHPRVQCTLEVTREGDAWNIERARFSAMNGGEKHALTIEFTPALGPATEKTAVELIAGKKKTIATGALAPDAASHALTLSFSNPAWLNGKTMAEGSVISNNSVSVTAHP
ncbi:MAG TPA: hypothetical protein VHY48_12845 [Acidobacteriaceae bacterium]|jgi:hypothetical protein|nr:hypothetical protein [Acidobacteriaceae bacterium]